MSQSVISQEDTELSGKKEGENCFVKLVWWFVLIVE
jgi:hypothetical protein